MWNQSKAQRVIEQTEDTITIMKKFNPRKKSSRQNASFPPLKVWLISVRSKNVVTFLPEAGPEVLNFIWCEKGLRGHSFTMVECNQIEMVSLHSVHQLSFLVEFMDPTTAKQIFGYL